MPDKETRVKVIGGLLGPLDVGQVRDVRLALLDWLEENKTEKGTEKGYQSVEAAEKYFKNVIETGQV